MNMNMNMIALGEQTWEKKVCTPNIGCAYVSR